MEIESQQVQVIDFYNDPLALMAKLNQIADQLREDHSSKDAMLATINYSGRLMTYVELVSQKGDNYVRMYLWKQDCSLEKFKRILERFEDPTTAETFRDRGVCVAIWGQIPNEMKGKLIPGNLVHVKPLQDVKIWNNKVLQGRSQWSKVKVDIA